MLKVGREKTQLGKMVNKFHLRYSYIQGSQNKERLE